MSNMQSKQKLIFLIFFSFIFFLGTIIFNDYGISIDEDNSRVNGFVTLKYIFELFKFSLISDLNNIISVPHIHSYSEQGNGVVFDLPLALIEILFKIEDPRKIFLTRHYFTFLIFFISLFFFFLLLKNRFKSFNLAILGVLFLILSPRIFAQSFYNSKDIIFMSLNLINLFFGIKYLENSNFKSTLFFGIFSGLNVGVRLLGVYVPTLILLIKLIQILRTDQSLKNHYFNFVVTFFFMLFFIYLFWPFLWENPLTNFLEAFNNIGNHQVGIRNFFLGKYIPVEFVPWYYSFVWIGVTTPIFYLILFILGIFFSGKRIFNRILKIDEIKKNNDLWRGNNEKIDFIIFLSFFLPLFVIILLHSSLYTGWRHLYFVYPFLIYFCIYQIMITKNVLLKKNKILILFVFIFLTPNFIWIFKNHPYQFVYFNSIVSKNFNKYFDMDYWGVSNFQSLRLILEKNKDKRIIYVYLLGNGDLNLSRSFLIKSEKERIKITDNLNDADFLIDNYARWYGQKISLKNFSFKDNFKIYHQIKVNQIPINSIYTKIFD